MLVAVRCGNRDETEHVKARSCQFEKSPNRMVSALRGAAYGAIIYARRKYDPLTIEMLVAVPHGNHHEVEHRDTRSYQSERSPT